MWRPWSLRRWHKSGKAGVVDYSIETGDRTSGSGRNVHIDDGMYLRGRLCDVDDVLILHDTDVYGKGNL
jgi:hypothetical protein